MNRRQYLKQSLFLPGSVLLSHALHGSIGQTREKISILIRSSWQTVNIGDIGHTPGLLRILEKYLPDADIRLWPSDVGNGVREILQKRFPRLIIATNKSQIDAAFKECHFLLHGSGASLVAGRDVDRWHNDTGKPYGVYGITFPGVWGRPTSATERKVAQDVETLNKAAFVFFRDSVSLGEARKRGVINPVMDFGPDGAFGVDLENDEAADAFLSEHDLEPGKFMCVIPRQRFTPYWEITDQPFNQERNDRNELMREHDNAPLREAIIAVTRKTPLKILICSEDQTQVQLGKKILFDPLPDDVKAKTVWRDKYWLTDEAVSTYKRSVGLFGLEMHSPIMCVGNGIPAVVCRFTEQTSKGFMWRDIGLGDWLFDVDVESDIRKIVPTVLGIATDPKKAKAMALKAKRFVEQRQEKTMKVLKHSLPSKD